MPRHTARPGALRATGRAPLLTGAVVLGADSAVDAAARATVYVREFIKPAVHPHPVHALAPTVTGPAAAAGQLRSRSRALQGACLPVVGFLPRALRIAQECRAYINPYVSFYDNGAKWRCNLCGIANDTPAGYHSPLNVRCRAAAGRGDKAVGRRKVSASTRSIARNFARCV